MGHHRLLALKFNPISQIELLRLGIVIPCDLLGQKFDNEWLILELVRSQTKVLQSKFSSMHLRGRGLFIQIPDDHALNLRARLGTALDHSKNGKFSNYACFLQYGSSCCHNVSAPGCCSSSSAILWRGIDAAAPH